MRIETTVGSDDEMWSVYWQGVEDTATEDPALAAETREKEKTSIEIFDRLKEHFSDKEEELSIIDAFENQFYKRSEVCELTGMNPKVFDRAKKRIQRAASKLIKKKEALKNGK